MLVLQTRSQPHVSKLAPDLLRLVPPTSMGLDAFGQPSKMPEEDFSCESKGV